MKITHTRVSFKDNRYHRAIPKLPSKNIPQSLFDTIVAVQTALDELHLQAKRYNEEVKDKPMTIAKNHPIPVAEGEIVKFNQDETDPSV